MMRAGRKARNGGLRSGYGGEACGERALPLLVVWRRMWRGRVGEGNAALQVEQGVDIRERRGADEDDIIPCATREAIGATTSQ